MPDNAFVGTWELVSATFYRTNGDAVKLYGEAPLGRVTYDARGRMAVQIMERERPALPRGLDAQRTADDYKAILRGYISYFGTYDVDPQGRTIAHHVHASLVPEWVGTDLVRTYEFSGKRLTLHIPPARLRGEMLRGELVWERVE